MVPVLVILAGALLLVAAGLQLTIPRIAAARIRAQLTESGGTAEVAVWALPATQLLRRRGRRLIVRGRELEIELATGEASGAGLVALDGFEEVDVELQDFRAGPFAIAAFVLARSGQEGYAMAIRGTITGAELARLGEPLLAGLPGAGLVGTVVGSLPLGGREVSMGVEIELISEGGALRVGTGGGTIAGYPAGPVATLIAANVARRLMLAP